MRFTLRRRWYSTRIWNGRIYSDESLYSYIELAPVCAYTAFSAALFDVLVFTTIIPRSSSFRWFLVRVMQGEWAKNRLVLYRIIAIRQPVSVGIRIFHVADGVVLPFLMPVAREYTVLCGRSNRIHIYLLIRNFRVPYSRQWYDNFVCMISRDAKLSATILFRHTLPVGSARYDVLMNVNYPGIWLYSVRKRFSSVCRNRYVSHEYLSEPMARFYRDKIYTATSLTYGFELPKRLI